MIEEDEQAAIEPESGERRELAKKNVVNMEEDMSAPSVSGRIYDPLPIVPNSIPYPSMF